MRFPLDPITRRAASTQVARVIGVIACLVAAEFVAAQSQTPPTWTLPKEPPVWPTEAPSPRLCRYDAGTTRFGSDIYRDVSCRTRDKLIAFDWRYKTTADLLDRAHTTEQFETDYWPTFVRIIGDSSLFVTGKASDGGAVLEHWTFSKESPAGARTPSVETACAEGSWLPHYEWNLPARKVVEILRLKPDAPQGLIRGLFQNVRSKDQLLVYYDGSREVYSLDLITRAQTLQAGPTSSAPLQVAALTGAFHRYWEADYKQRGYCYLFGPEPGVLDPEGMPQLLVLIDSDRDGKIDSSHIVSADAWTSEGWSDLANIAEPKH